MDVVTPGDPDGRPAMIDDEPSADERADDAGGPPPLDLSPRTGPDDGTGASRGTAGGRGWVWIGVLVLLVAGIGFVISRAITDATQFYLTADEAVARRPELAGRTFRLEGTVLPGTPRPTAAGVTFTVANNGTQVTVEHAGDPPQLFQPCIPVVVEGRWASTAADAPFASTAIIVAHDENYEEQNSERIQQAKAEGAESPECAKQEAVAQR